MTKLSMSVSLLVAFTLVVACAAQNYDMQWDADTSVIEAQPSPASPTNGSTFDDIMQEIEMMTLQEELQQQDNIW